MKNSYLWPVGRKLIKSIFYRLFVLGVFLFLIVSCQGTPPNQVPETDLALLEEQLHIKLNGFIGSDQEMGALSAKNETVYMVDVNTG